GQMWPDYLWPPSAIERAAAGTAALRRCYQDAPHAVATQFCIVARPESRQALRPNMQQANLGMIGGGTVGSGVFHALQLNGTLMSSRIGVKINLRKIAVKAFEEPRPYEIPESCMTTDWQAVV